MTLMRIYYQGWEDDHLEIESLEFHPELLQTLHELGIIEISGGYIKRSQLRRLYKLQRLRDCLGVNLTGSAIILDLLERIEELQAELDYLKGGR